MVVLKQAERKDKNGTDHKQSTDRCARSRSVFNIREDPVNLKMHVRILIRNILVFLLLALHEVVDKAFQLGTDKAKRKRKTRKGISKPPEDLPRRTTRHLQQAETENRLLPMQTPKRQPKLNLSSTMPAVSTPKRPFMLPISPRAQIDWFTLNSFTKPRMKAEGSPLQHHSAC